VRMAAAKSFVPHGGVPVPAERPWGLGQGGGGFGEPPSADPPPVRLYR
jgi:hypothetical protein